MNVLIGAALYTSALVHQSNNESTFGATVLPNGNYVLAWQKSIAQSNNLFIQLYSPNGEALTLTQNLIGNTISFDIGSFSNNSYIITWGVNNQTLNVSNNSVFACSFDFNGEAINNSEILSTGLYPQVSTFSDDSYIVAINQGDNAEILQYESSGQLNNEIKIAFDQDISTMDLASCNDDSFVILLGQGNILQLGVYTSDLVQLSSRNISGFGGSVECMENLTVVLGFFDENAFNAEFWTHQGSFLAQTVISQVQSSNTSESSTEILSNGEIIMTFTSNDEVYAASFNEEGTLQPIVSQIGLVSNLSEGNLWAGNNGSFWAVIAGNNSQVANLEQFSPISCAAKLGNCPGPYFCEEGSGLCLECKQNQECNSTNPFCDKGFCNECLNNGECDGKNGTQYCNTVQIPSTCVECILNVECSGGKTCVGGLCVKAKCTSNTECTTNISTPICDIENGECVGCLNSTDCTNSNVCNKVTNQCVQCASNEECGNGELCYFETGICVECLANSECGGGENCENYICVSQSGGSSAWIIIICVLAAVGLIVGGMHHYRVACFKRDDESNLGIIHEQMLTSSSQNMNNPFREDNPYL